LTNHCRDSSLQPIHHCRSHRSNNQSLAQPWLQQSITATAITVDNPIIAAAITATLPAFIAPID
jgi:hypothetical protein